MEKLALCRMCLAKDVPLRLVVQENLQEMFKQLTAVPFVTDDCRPAVACVMCCARLRNCYEFMNNCLQSEELLQRVLNSDVLSPVTIEQLPSTKRFCKSPVIHTNYSGVRSDHTDVHVEGQNFVFYDDDDIKVNTEISKGDNIVLGGGQYVEYADVSQQSSTEVDPLNKYSYEITLKVEELDLEICDDIIIDEERAPERLPQSKTHEDTTSHEKNELTVGQAVQKSRCEMNRKQPDKICASPSEKKYECDFCNELFNLKSRLIAHIRIHTGDKPYKCNYCNTRFDRKAYLDTHNRIHTGDKPYKCNICNKGFIQSKYLVEHYRIHTGDKPYQCSICSKYFSHRSTLTIHNRIHTGEKPYKCNICSKGFTNNGCLVKHNRIHSGDKPYMCKICSKCFTNKGSISQHARTHTGDRPYKCNNCFKSFIRNSHLVVHNRIHTGEKPHKCNICSKCFSAPSSLIAHNRTHTVEKSHKKVKVSKSKVKSPNQPNSISASPENVKYKCEFCSKCFIDNYGLDRHIRIHSGDKPYKCNICLKCFSQKSHLNRHNRLHTGDK